ncbi:bifunctional GTP diphosphokinase/guanosine-3',5'-bis pyrophosphate 3'-pyrophosphohydrolase [Gilvimarinus agarilyticus]|uniref:bifunctional GTP diphosphokinase/guanosine-3',5'-bis pyrophosphate 3'-pyrophosphohydrolase n=1 Tax=unclassified Gilvimarinus TaxID=2642066 RepID=UPI001C082978|nr:MULTISPECIES: bifunctional GTP diphosphokinase/guanosine-3',5'-bis pyrophosphate 3'-pyrophosphohydrolase [unclassified Gilvimarinus]MBU2884519.1 bifunctional GTP diphosphokinase/guanosine-3',5'-bis pyrophosphate 3'-pyrophosphohydrolase [Gilvimarinus agarilyticus]MDO6569648.1 bifunctional GTP diphosphokinase/guanosine-3',5'-bis pyrophosphate 3'-pyrophosphohydrolase [Gilvimarinus sp. 2_MG-2023]MDO6748028.1 bifunctional GTP diphosphokinase/guanosine-3',5'-bis pyrophosphate 3'-pyrophosphohydrolas
MLTIEALSHRLSSYLEPPQIEQVKRAYFYAEQAHDGQKRRSGEDYITHPLAVADILSGMHMDHQSLMAAMLHDVIEDTGIPKKAIAKQFGDTVAELVDGVSKLTQIEFESHAEKQAENFQKMALAMADDLRVILVKLADRLHNMRTLGAMPPHKKRRIAKETLEIYAPIAHRLGMNDLRLEFEDRGFYAMYPLRATRMQAALKTARGNRKELVEQIQTAIEKRLNREKITAVVIGREKHLFSIYQKMRQKKKFFKEIMDVYAFRIIVDSIDACYRALGMIHNLYKPVAGEFKDYIAIPKANGYQSLHTVLVGMHGVPIEVQIRTKEMDEMANTGIAAHFLYKSDSDDSLSSSHNRARQWVQGLLEMQRRAGDSLEFIENVKIDLFPDEVYVFTPKGRIVELPHGATAVDFAYAVHTDIGNTCVACRINGRLAPLSQPLRSGQKVTIITAPGAQPNPSWLDFSISGKARSSIRHFLKNQRHHQSVALGRKMLSRALGDLDLDIDQLTEEQTQKLLQPTGAQSLEALCEDIGLGNRIAFAVAKLLQPDADIDPRGGSIYSPLSIDSSDGVLITFAKCCRPIPGDPILGHISSGKGLVIHQDTCHNLAEFRDNPEKISHVNWAPTVTGEFLVDIRAEVESERGIIATLATRITEQGASIEHIHVNERDAHNSVINLCIGVKNRIHLANIMRRVRNLSFVIRIHRAKN